MVELVFKLTVKLVAFLLLDSTSDVHPFSPIAVFIRH